MNFFRNDAEAARFASLHRPFQSLGDPPDYASRYGARAANAAQGCRDAHVRGDARSLQINQHALALVLFADQPQLFDVPQRLNVKVRKCKKR
jgi:hypothetical protein